MVGYKACLLKRKAPVVQQGTDIVAVVQHAKLTPDQDSDEDRVPAGRLTPHDLRTGIDELHQAFFLPRGQLRSAPAAMVVDEALQGAQQKGFRQGVETSRAEAPPLTQHRHGHLVYKQVE